MIELGCHIAPGNTRRGSLLRHWDEQPHIIAAKGTENWHWESELVRSVPWREQLIAELNGRPIGYLEIIDAANEESHYWEKVPQGFKAIDIWIGDAAELGKGYGTKMMRQAIERCFKNQTALSILVDPDASNERAHRFYEKLGFRYIERRRFPNENEDCLIYRLDRSSWAVPEIVTSADNL